MTDECLRDRMLVRKKMIVGFLIGLFLIYITMTGAVYIGQKGMIFIPAREIAATPADIGLHFEDIVLRTQDNMSISAWYIPAQEERAVLLFCHGNAGNSSHRLNSIRLFHDLKISVLIFDYRGYGKSEGSPTEEGTYLDAEAALDYLINSRHVHPEKIVVFGRSLGGAVAAETALRHKVGALIIESGFTSVPELGDKYYPFLPVKLLSRYSYATIDKVGRINAPKLFIHSPNDEIIPFQHGRALYEKASPPKEFLEISGDHNNGFLISGSGYTEGLDRFIAKYF
ncbi:MAG: lysophospholipase [Nitrospirae bacterium]|nr:lysophospholipase [Nitrospirota bacterium]